MTPPPPAPTAIRRVLPWLGAGLLLSALLLVAPQAKLWIAAAPETLRGLGPWGPVAFVAAYAAATVAFVPGSALTLAAGAIFGLGQGVVLVFVGATLGSSLAFLVARTIARGAIERRLAGNAKFEAIDRAVARDGRRIVLLLRLSPAFPFALLNYGLGLTRVSFRDYVIASVGMLPGTVLYVYYGKVAGDVARLAGGASAPRGLEYYLTVGVGLAATIAVTVLIANTARRALADAGAVAPAAATTTASPDAMEPR
ncbi:MAG: TVP38/TMEM64 family protein [Gemmatimonadaceae bacterium]|nr:TVP38/TMEM64 family protein [Gemmatimonadaceae bacterium]